MNEQLLSVFRYGLAFVGGLLANSGWISGDDWTAVSGALLTLVSVGWSIWLKINTARVPVNTLTSKQVEITGKSPNP